MKGPLLFLSLIFLLRLPIAIGTQLTEDEAYYWQWSRNLNLSYYDHPPMVAYLIKVSTSVFGDNEFGVRFPALLLSFLTGLFIFLYLKKKGGVKSAWNGLIISSLVILFAVGSVIITPDTPLLFFSLVSIWFLEKERTNISTLFAGFFFGLALLSKYTAILLMPAMLFGFISDGKIELKRIVIFFVISFLIFLPVLIWNIKFDWVSFKFQFSHGLGTRGVNVGNLLLYLRDTLLVLSFPLSILILFYSFKSTIITGWKPLTLSAWIPFLFFLWTSLKTLPEANWPGISYIFIIILASLTIPRNRLFWVFSSIAAVMILYIHIHTLFGFKVFKKDPTWRMHGWREITEKVENIRGGLPVTANNYQWASLLSFYLKDKPFVPALNIQGRKNQYSLWQKPLYKKFIFVGKAPPALSDSFQRVEKITEIESPYRKVPVYIIER